MADLLTHLLLFWLTVGLLGLPFVARLPLDPVEKIAVGFAASLALIYLFAGGIFLLHADVRWFWLLPPIALVNAAVHRATLRAWFTDYETRAALISYALLTAWCVAWLGLVVSYSGGGWAGDWIEHYERVRFFLEHWPDDTRLAGIYFLPARPPLANLVTGAFQALARGGFASFQLFSTLFASLVFWPVCLCARRWGRLSTMTAATGAALALALSPLFVQNAAFAWTKLPAAFLILLGLYLYLEGMRRPDARLCLTGAAVLGAAAITHYSTGPYLVGLAVAHLLLRRSTVRESIALAAAFAALPATWFAWSLAHFGAATTFASNTSITGNPKLGVSWWTKAAANLYNTIVPHPLASEANGFMSQTSVWAGWRDFFFNLYQVNLPWAFGSVGCVIVVRALALAWRDGQRGVRGPVAVALLVLIVAGIVTNGDLDPHGTTHLSLQSLVLAGVALIAASWPTLPRGWRWALALGWAFDAAAGIALHFANQGFLIDRWLHPGKSVLEIIATFSVVGQINFNAKLYHQTVFLGEHYGLTPALLLPLLAVLLLALALHARPAPGFPGDAAPSPRSAEDAAGAPHPQK